MTATADPISDTERAWAGDRRSIPLPRRSAARGIVAAGLLVGSLICICPPRQASYLQPYRRTESPAFPIARGIGWGQPSRETVRASAPAAVIEAVDPDTDPIRAGVDWSQFALQGLTLATLTAGAAVAVSRPR